MNWHPKPHFNNQWSWAGLAILLIALVWQWWSGNHVADNVCSGQRFAIETVSGGTAPYIQLTANARKGPFLLDYGATQSTLSADAFSSSSGSGQASGQMTTSFSLPTFPTGQFRLARYFASQAPGGGQLGVVGTDFLSLLTAAFSFSPQGGSVVLDGKPCDAGRLRAKGMVPIRQTGFFSAQPGRLDRSRPNVPVIYLRIGGITTWAQIDTGYDDLQMQPSIDINETLYQKLLASNVPLRQKGNVGVSTCSGLESRSAYLASHVEIVSETGALIRDLGTVTLVRKPLSPCGGIGNLVEPAAQIAASVVARLGEVVIDPFTETVWVAPAR